MKVQQLLTSFCPICQWRRTNVGQICLHCQGRLPPGVCGQVMGMRFSSFTQYAPDNHEVKKLILARKNRFETNLVSNAWIEWVIRQPVAKGSWIVAAPGKHAESLAHIASSALELFCWRFIEKRDETRQSLLGKKKRRLLALKSVENLSIPKQVILIDDVLTSGATALKCFEALNRPDCFQLLCFAYRPLLLNSQRFASMRR